MGDGCAGMLRLSWDRGRAEEEGWRRNGEDEKGGLGDEIV